MEMTSRGVEQRIKNVNGGLYRTPGERERDRALVAKGYLTGKSVAKIADVLNLPVSVVQSDLDTIREAWKSSAIADYNERTNIELARLDALEQVYWDAWWNSLEENERQKRETRTSQRTQWTIAQVTKNTRQLGEAQYLQGVERCIDRRIKLLGLDAPTKSVATTTEGERPYDPLTDAARVGLLLSAFVSRGTADEPERESDDVISGVAVER